MKRTNKSLSMLIISILVLAVPLFSVAAGAEYPGIIPLKNGFQPEGITVGTGHTFYTGSLNGGAIFRGDLRTGEVEMIAPTGSKMSVGMKYDQRSGLLFVAGGVFGTAYVYNGETGDMVTSYQLTTNPSFINDVILTGDSAYFTDSSQKQFYRLPLGPNGSLPAPADVQTIPLGANFDFTPGAFNANGIEASPDGSLLLIINTNSGILYQVNPSTGDATAVDLAGGSLLDGDGILLIGHTLYVVQNFLNKIAVVELDPGFRSGTITGYLSSPFFHVPATVAPFGDAVYVANTHFDQVPVGGATPSDTFEAVRVPIH